MDLRTYQHQVVDDVEAALEAGYRRILLVAPTGAGKTIISVAIIAATVRKHQAERTSQ